MITAAAILRGDRERLLAFDAGGAPAGAAARAAASRRIWRPRPASARSSATTRSISTAAARATGLHSGAFGACLMLEPGARGRLRGGDACGGAGSGDREDAHRRRSAAAREARAAVAQLRRERLRSPAGVRGAACAMPAARSRSCMRARRCSGGLSPKENREVPPLRYDVVQPAEAGSFRAARCRQRRPARGGAVLEALDWCDGVMLGREAYHRPCLCSPSCSSALSGQQADPLARAMLERMADYAGRGDGSAASAPARHHPPHARALRRAARRARLPPRLSAKARARRAPAPAAACGQAIPARRCLGSVPL